MTLTYSLLLKLNRGAAAVVENLSNDEVAALSVETPVTTFLRGLAERETPRHVFLTGNAGDGKTFAVQTVTAADPDRWGQEFHCELDAAGVYEAGEDPVRSLEASLEAALRDGKRLLVAINRGQLERLNAHLAPDSELGGVVGAAVAQLDLQVTPTEDPDGDVLTLDLGLVDTLADEVVGPLIEKAISAEDGEDLSAETAAAFTAAKAELADPAVRAELRRALDAVRAAAVHVTMRRLWRFVAHLLTGWRLPQSRAALTLEDSVAARLYSDRVQHGLVPILRERADPALTPLPRAAELLLTGGFVEALKEKQNLAPLLQADASAAGAAALRVAATYDVAGDPRPAVADSKFDRAMAALKDKPPGWVDMGQTPWDLLSGIYRELGLPEYGSEFLRWQRLCYDTRRAGSATLLADKALDYRAFRLALPRPSRAAEEAFAGAWAPPVLLLAHVDADGDVTAGALRLRPNLFDRLLGSAGGGRPLPAAETEVLRRWLAGQPAVDSSGGEIKLGRRSPKAVASLQKDPLEGDKLSFKWQ